MYLGKVAGQETPPMFTGGGCPERGTGQAPSGHTMDITLKCKKAYCCLFLWTTFPLRLVSAGPTRGLQGIHKICFVKVLKLKNHQLRFTTFLKIG